MKTVLMSILSVFIPKAPAAPTMESMEIESAQQEFFRANDALRQAQVNFDHATPTKISVDMAIHDLNVAFDRADSAMRKLRMVTGISKEDSEPCQRQRMSQK
jgi:hypothetical protein